MIVDSRINNLVRGRWTARGSIPEWNRSPTQRRGVCTSSVNVAPLYSFYSLYSLARSVGGRASEQHSEAFYSLSTATCRAYKLPMTNSDRPKRHGVHLQRQRRTALQPLQPLQPGTVGGQPSKRAAF